MAEVKTAVKTRQKTVSKEVEMVKPVVVKPVVEKKKATNSKVKVEKEKVLIQFAGKTYEQKDLVKIAKDVWVYDLGNKAGDFKTVELYVKPEERVAYYVINQTETGCFEI